MYYTLLNEVPDSEQDAMLEGSYKDIETEDFPFNIGTYIDKPGFDIPVVLNVGQHALRGVMTDHLSIDSIEGLVFSQKAKDFIYDNAEGNIQFFPMVIIDEFSNQEEVLMAEYKDKKVDYQTTTYDKFHVANIVGLIDCVNHDSSNLEYFEPRPVITEDMSDEMKEALSEDVSNDIDFIHSLTLDESKIPEDLQIFRLKDCPRIIVFKENIVNAIREAKLTGFVFIPLEEYTDEIPDDDDDDDAENEAAPKEQQLEKTPEPPKEEPAATPAPKKTIIIKSIKRN